MNRAVLKLALFLSQLAGVRPLISGQVQRLLPISLILFLALPKCEKGNGHGP